jgi:hypothetical protein
LSLMSASSVLSICYRSIWCSDVLRGWLYVYMCMNEPLFGNVLCPALWLFEPWIYDVPSWSVCVTDECQYHALPPNTCSNACLFAFLGFDC